MEIINLIDLLPRHATKVWEPRTAPVDCFCVHHSATASTVTVQQITRYHVYDKDMSGIQYHYVITAEGAIYQTQPDSAFVWHGHDFNTGLGVCLIGDFSTVRPPTAQFEAARWLLAEKRRQYGPLSLVGHGEAPSANTECPGRTWPEWRAELEQEDEMTKHGPFIASYQTGAESGPSVDTIVYSDMPMVGQIFEGMPFAGPLWTGNKPKRVFARFWVEGAGLKGDAYEATFMVRGAAGADDYVALLRPRYEAAMALGIRDVKGPNEPQPTEAEKPAHLAFWLRWVELLRGLGLRPWVMNWSSGTPRIEDVGYWVPAIRAARAAGGGLSAHHYNAPHLLNDPFGEWPQYGDMWYSRRFEFNIDALYAAGLERGAGWYLISECGIDGNGIKWDTDPAFAGKRKRLGWRNWGDWLVNWTTYRAELETYAQYVQARPEILAVELFVTHPRAEWASFNYDVEQLAWMAARWAGYVAQQPPPVVDVEQAIGDALQRHIIPLNPQAALERAGAARGLLPASDEVRDVAGYVAQAFRRAGEEQTQHIAYCVEGDWGNVKWFTRAN